MSGGYGIEPAPATEVPKKVRRIVQVIFREYNAAGDVVMESDPDGMLLAHPREVTELLTQLLLYRHAEAVRVTVDIAL